LPIAEDSDLGRVADHHRRLIDARADVKDLIRTLTGLGFCHDIVLFADRLASPGARPLTHEDAAVPAFFAGIQRLRDVILVTWGWGLETGDDAAECSTHTRPAEKTGERSTIGALGGWGMPRPQVPRILAAIEVVRQAASLAPEDARAPLLAMLGWL